MREEALFAAIDDNNTVIGLYQAYVDNPEIPGVSEDKIIIYPDAPVVVPGLEWLEWPEPGWMYLNGEWIHPKNIGNIEN